MFDDKLFEYLVATDRIDEVLGTKNKNDNNIVKEDKTMKK